jgi:hypothetical protein
MTVDLRPAKAEAARTLAPGNPGREAIMMAKDEVAVEEFDLLVPVWIRLLRLRTER